MQKTSKTIKNRRKRAKLTKPKKEKKRKITYINKGREITTTDMKEDKIKADEDT